MGKLQVRKEARQWSFQMHGMQFNISIDPWNDEGLHPQQILVHELEECVRVLKDAPQYKAFSLPPVKPEKDK